MRQLNKLTARFVATAEPGFWSDGGGLYLRVDSDGRANWIFRFARGGKQRDMGLGSARDLPLADARKLATEARALIAFGEDPLVAKQTRKAKAQTFAEAADALIASMSPSWKSDKHTAQWRMTLGDAYCGSIRSMDVAKIKTEHILEILKPIWRAKPETATRVRGRIERVLNSAKAAGFIPSPWDNPARWSGHLDHILPKRLSLSRGHHTAMAYKDVPAFMQELRARPAHAALALELTILTAARTSEVLLAKLVEFDLDQAIWIIPAARTKMKWEHRVPLSPRVVEIVDRLQLLGSDWLIPGIKPGKPLSNMAMLMLLDRMGKDVTTHGFRSAFKDWASEMTPFSNEVIEMALAHAIEDKTQAAYRCGNLFEKRRQLMNLWAAYCTTPPTGKVVPLRGHA
jgi:integrase